MELKELCIYLDELLNVKTCADYCRNGLQVEGTSEVTSIATAVSASLATIEAAVQAGVQVLIVHHPLFWDKEPLIIAGSKRKKLAKLLESEISLLGYHLPLDAHPLYGNNWGAARLMGWTDLRPFGLYNGISLGVQGRIDAQTRSQFAEKLEAFYGHTAHSALGGKEMIESCALISGGAHKSILDAALQGIDCFITGSFDEPIWHQAFEEKINFFALGHSNTEKVGVQLLGQHLRDHFSISYQFLDVPNPF